MIQRFETRIFDTNNRAFQSRGQSARMHSGHVTLLHLSKTKQKKKNEIELFIKEIQCILPM